MIGDVLTSSILFESLKKHYPKAELHYLINSHTFPVVENHPLIDEFVFFTSEMQQNKIEIWHLIKKVRKARYDIVIDIYSKLSSNLLTFFSKSDRRISYYKYYTWFFYTDTVKRIDKAKTNAGLAIENRIQLLEPLGIDIQEPVRPVLYLTKDEQENAKNILQVNGIDLNRPLFMISVLGSGPSKTYPFNYMAQLIDLVCADLGDAQILFNYIPSQASEAKAIYELCQPSTQKQIFMNVFGKSLRDFMSLTSFCNAMIGNEGGAINMAKALNVPTFSIFAPWIEKSHWSIFDNATTHISVHLEDYNRTSYENLKKYKDLKDKSKSLYQLFAPELFKEQLSKFLMRINPLNND